MNKNTLRELVRQNCCHEDTIFLFDTSSYAGTGVLDDLRYYPSELQEIDDMEWDTIWRISASNYHVDGMKEIQNTGKFVLKQLDFFMSYLVNEIQARMEVSIHG